MDNFGLVIAFIGLMLISTAGLQSQISKLKRKLKSRNEIDSVTIHNILKEHIGQEIALGLFDDSILADKTLLLDVDDKFVLLEIHNKKEITRGLYRIEDIESVEIITKK